MASAPPAAGGVGGPLAAAAAAGRTHQQQLSPAAAAAAARGGPAQFSFQLSCDINQQVKVKVAELQGLLPSVRRHQHLLCYSLQAAQDHEAQRQQQQRQPEQPDDASAAPTQPAPPASALYLTAVLTSCRDTLGLEARTAYAQAGGASAAAGLADAGSGCSTSASSAVPSTARWDQWLSFSVKVGGRTTAPAFPGWPLRCWPLCKKGRVCVCGGLCRGAGGGGRQVGAGRP